jgi:hypothetical protein
MSSARIQKSPKRACNQAVCVQPSSSPTTTTAALIHPLFFAVRVFVAVHRAVRLWGCVADNKGREEGFDDSRGQEGVVRCGGRGPSGRRHSQGVQLEVELPCTLGQAR